jgi:pimeloyl-ACP methyl ester carboxylesterase
MSVHVLDETTPETAPLSIIGTNVRIAAGDEILRGELIVPPVATGIVICAGARSECAAEIIRGQGQATLLLPLLTSREQSEDQLTHSFHFNVPLMAERLVAATRWLAHQPETANLGFGYFGEELEGAAALVAAAELGVVIDAVVCRQTRPDFAANALPRIEAATLLICSKDDAATVAVSRRALDRMKCEKQLQTIPPPCDSTGLRRDCVGCTLAASWFRTYVRPR